MEKLCAILIISFQLFLISCQAQVPGCTDSLANNYNSSATTNDGSCTYDPYSVAPTSTMGLSETLQETSGLIIWDGYVWSHNDNTDTILYGLDTANADIVTEHQLPGIENISWEEISQDEDFIYLGDFGNNTSGNRTDLHLLRIDKLSLKAGNPIIDTIWFTYSDQTDFSPREPNQTDYDCEAMIVTMDSIYLFTKQWISAFTSIYSLPKIPGIHVAKYKAKHNVQGLITGSTFLESERLLVLTGYTSLLSPFFYLLYDFTGSDFFSGNKRRLDVSLPFHQIEGIATNDGLKYYVTNELFTFQPIVNNPQKLHIFDLNSFLEGYLSGQGTGRSPLLDGKSLLIYPNPSDNEIIVKMNDLFSSTPFTIFDQSGREVLSGVLSGETTRLDVSCLKTGLYVFKIGGKDNLIFNLVKF